VRYINTAMQTRTVGPERGPGLSSGNESKGKLLREDVILCDCFDNFRM